MSARPNILLLLTDQHRLSACSPYGPTPCQTPAMQRLADVGMRFENAYTTCPVCSPARATIMTGLYPHSHGTMTNIYGPGCLANELADQPRLLSRRLENAGYRLGYTGKWHLGEQTLPCHVGFEGHNCPGHGNGGFGFDAYHRYLEQHSLSHQVTEVVRGCGVLQEPLEATVPYFLADNTIQLMDQFAEGDAPFFIWHNFWGPHAPYFATEEFLSLYENIEIPPWPNFDWPARQIPGPHQSTIHALADGWTWREWEQCLRFYYAFTSMIDSQIGRILDHLDNTGLTENTIVILAADHGETLGSHGGLINKGFHHFEETHRIPMIVRSPGRLEPDVIQTPVSLADLYPTILDATETADDFTEAPGTSLLPLLAGQALARDMVVTEFNGVDGVVATLRTLRWDRFKYGFNVGNRDELYDLQSDPYETVNRIDDPAYQEVRHEAEDRLYQWMQQTGDQAKSVFVRTHACRHPAWIEGSPAILGNPLPSTAN